jgi:hypothetical protein
MESNDINYYIIRARHVRPSMETEHMCECKSVVFYVCDIWSVGVQERSAEDGTWTRGAVTRVWRNQLNMEINNLFSSVHRLLL